MSAQARRLVSGGGLKKASAALSAGTSSATPSRTSDAVPVRDKGAPRCGRRMSAL
jgi:hypothetical protein